MQTKLKKQTEYEAQKTVANNRTQSGLRRNLNREEDEALGEGFRSGQRHKDRDRQT